VVEWGAPHGAWGRVAPARVIQSLGQPFLWILDRADLQVNAAFWESLGFDLQRSHFICEIESLRTFKMVLQEGVYGVVVLDTKKNLRSGDWSFVSQIARQKKVMPFVIRPFYLTPRNGNPFAKHRWNSFYSFEEHSLRLKCVKGLKLNKEIKAPLQEVLYG
jgi:hypothetical protein